MGVTYDRSSNMQPSRVAKRAALVSASAKLLGEKIKSSREKLGWTQQELANRVGSISKQSVTLWEKGRTRPTTGHLIRLPSILGVDSSWLFSDEAPLNMEVPILSKVSAGRLQANEAVELWDNVPRVIAAGLPVGRWIALWVEGDSMNLVAAEGSLIFVNRDETDLISGKTYVIATEDGEATFKRYRANPDRFEPVTTATGHETLFPEGAIKVIGRVRRVQADL